MDITGYRILQFFFLIPSISIQSFLCPNRKRSLKAVQWNGTHGCLHCCPMLSVQLRPSKNLLRETMGVYEWKWEPDGEVKEAINFPLSVAKETMSSSKVTGHRWHTGNGCWRTENERDWTLQFKLTWYTWTTTSVTERMTRARMV